MFGLKRRVEKAEERIDRLYEQVRKVENKATIEMLPTDQGSLFLRLINPDISASDAVKALADHLGVKFTTTPAVPARVEVKTTAPMKRAAKRRSK